MDEWICRKLGNGISFVLIIVGKRVHISRYEGHWSLKMPRELMERIKYERLEPLS